MTSTSLRPTLRHPAHLLNTSAHAIRFLTLINSRRPPLTIGRWFL
jgi:hypothetical protein